jgi:hypothetical protein
MAELSQDISASDEHCLEYLINGNSKKVDKWPAHPYFEIVDSPKPFPLIYSDFSQGHFVSRIWTDTSSRKGVTLILPSIKSDDHFWETILLADWLCSFSSMDGFVGAFHNDYSPKTISLLFSSNKKLKMYSGVSEIEFDAAEFIRSE